ncbi:hypothetical protein ACP275_01G078800 [Erythranthe tilingii]
MTNNDDKFHQRWEFRRREVDADTSSDESKSNSKDLILLEDKDEKTDTPQSQMRNTAEPKPVEPSGTKMKSKSEPKPVEPSGTKMKSINEPKPVEPSGTKIKSKSVPKKKPKAKRKKTLNAATNEGVVMFKDLKIFGDSLIQELKVDRENMFARMRQEMAKLVASSKSSNLNPIKKKVPSKNRTKTSAKPTDKTVISHVASHARKSTEGDILRQSANPRTNLGNGSSSDQVVSSPYLTLPTVVSKPQRNNLVRSDMENGKSQTEERLFGRFSDIYHRSVGLLGQNFSQTGGSLPVGFPIPLHQKMGNGSNMFVDNSIVQMRMNNGGGIVRFPEGIEASSERVFFPNGISTFVPRKLDGEFASLRPNDIKDGQFYRASSRKDN